MSWNLDLTHSQIQFSVRHMMISKVRGEFPKFSGSVSLDENNPANASLDITIDVSSINTREAQRDGHLKSPDFFNVEVYPNITFKSTNVQVTGSNTAVLTGDLTIRDVTKPVSLDVEFLGFAKSPWGTTNAGFTASGKINREEFGLGWNVALETGGVLVGKDIDLNIEAELIKAPEAAAA
jgi:polyisoprenoid-binding protein YceI